MKTADEAIEEIAMRCYREPLRATLADVDKMARAILRKTYGALPSKVERKRRRA